MFLPSCATPLVIDSPSAEVDPALVLDNLSYCRAYTHEHQLSLLTLACARMVSERGRRKPARAQSMQAPHASFSC